VPEETGGVVEAVLLDLPSEVGPAGPAAPANIVLAVVPPKLESAEGTTAVVPNADDVVAAQKLLDIRSIVYSDLSHGSILHDKSVHWLIRTSQTGDCFLLYRPIRPPSSGVARINWVNVEKPGLLPQ
jgi:hypothetical protein